jgi:processive 1,2-diacylglycerol beta-glucosyltransferase
MEQRPTILVLAASAGAGHLVAAQALACAFRAQAPHANVEVLDVLSICNPVFRRLYAGGYLGLVRYAPQAMGWLYELMDRPGGGLTNAVRVWAQNLNKLPIVRHVQRRRPRLIASTHYLPAEIVAQMRRTGLLDCPQVTVTTDYETHRIWVQEPTERYYTATEDGKTYLAKSGADSNRIRVAGIPVRPGFGGERPIAEARQRCALAADRPVVLLLCGGFGVGPIRELLAELIGLPPAVQLVVIAGRNEQLRRRLESQACVAGRPVRVVGFTDVMHEWMRSADLVVTKPGGLTVAECLACGVPLVIVNPIPGQETRNSDYLLEHGAAIKVNNARLLGPRVAALLGDPARLATLRAAAQRLARPAAARDIAADALGLLA